MMSSAPQRTQAAYSPGRSRVHEAHRGLAEPAGTPPYRVADPVGREVRNGAELEPPGAPKGLAARRTPHRCIAQRSRRDPTLTPCPPNVPGGKPRRVVFMRDAHGDLRPVVSFSGLSAGPPLAAPSGVRERGTRPMSRCPERGRRCLSLQ